MALGVIDELLLFAPIVGLQIGNTLLKITTRGVARLDLFLQVLIYKSICNGVDYLSGQTGISMPVADVN